MRTEEEIYESAEDRWAFPNGTAWEIWSGNWCHRCVNDGMGIGKENPMCPLINVAILNLRTPSEWLRIDGPDTYHCVEFRPRDFHGNDDDEPPGDPPPHEEVPGQLELFDDEGLRGVRMWVDVVNEIRPARV